jgi:hypothetical protein
MSRKRRQCTHISAHALPSLSFPTTHNKVFIQGRKLLLLHSDGNRRGPHALSSYITFFSQKAIFHLTPFGYQLFAALSFSVGVFKLTDILVLLSIITSPTFLFTNSPTHHLRIYVVVYVSLLHKLIIYRAKAKCLKD